MLKRVMSAIAVAAVLLVAAPKAEAATLGLGARFAWDNYKTAVFTYATSNGQPDLTSVEYASPRFGGSFLLGIMQRRMVINFDLDLGIHSHTIFPYTYTGTTVDANWETKVTFFKLGIGAGLKFHFKKPETGKATGYVFAGLGKVFAKSSAEALDITVPDATQEDLDGQTEILSKLSAPFYWSVGVGAEFHAADAFSIGADIFGFRFEYAKADAGPVATSATAAGHSGEQKYLNFYMYSSLNLNFTIGGSVDGKKKEKKPADGGNSWGAPAAQPAFDEWGNPVAPAPAQPAPAPAQPAPAWGAPAAQPAAPAWGAPAVQPAPAAPAAPVAPAPVAPAPAPAPAPKASGGGGWNSPPPPPAP